MPQRLPIPSRLSSDPFASSFACHATWWRPPIHRRLPSPGRVRSRNDMGVLIGTGEQRVESVWPDFGEIQLIGGAPAQNRQHVALLDGPGILRRNLRPCANQDQGQRSASCTERRPGYGYGVSGVSITRRWLGRSLSGPRRCRRLMTAPHFRSAWLIVTSLWSPWPGSRWAVRARVRSSLLRHLLAWRPCRNSIGKIGR
jgi:hypothetical protein